MDTSYFNLVGNDRKAAWQKLGNLGKEDAMMAFIKDLRSACSLFEPWYKAHLKIEQEMRKRENGSLLDDRSGISSDYKENISSDCVNGIAGKSGTQLSQNTGSVAGKSVNTSYASNLYPSGDSNIASGSSGTELMEKKSFNKQVMTKNGEAQANGGKSSIENNAIAEGKTNGSIVNCGNNSTAVGFPTNSYTSSNNSQ